MMHGQHTAKKKTEQRAAEDARKNHPSNCYCTHDFLLPLYKSLTAVQCGVSEIR
jgi:hypothetical protein